MDIEQQAKFLPKYLFWGNKRDIDVAVLSPTWCSTIGTFFSASPAYQFVTRGKVLGEVEEYKGGQIYMVMEQD